MNEWQTEFSSRPADLQAGPNKRPLRRVYYVVLPPQKSAELLLPLEKSERQKSVLHAARLLVDAGVLQRVGQLVSKRAQRPRSGTWPD